MHHREAKPTVRVLHTAPEARMLDVYIDDVLVIGSIAYGQITGYGEVGRGDHRLTIVPAGSGMDARERFDADIDDLEASISTLAVTEARHGVGATLLDDTTDAPTPAHAKVRVLHTSPDLHELEVTLRNGRLFSTRVKFGEATPFAEVPAGIVDLELRSRGGSQPERVFPRYTLVPGNIYTLVVIGLSRDVPRLAIMPLIEEARVRVPVGAPV